MRIGVAAKVAIAAIGLAALTTTCVAWAAYSAARDDLLESELRDLVKDNDVAVAHLHESFLGLRTDALALAGTRPVEGLALCDQHGGTDPLDGSTAEQWTERNRHNFKAFLEAHPDYFQARMIEADAIGRELVRAERTPDGVRVAPEDDLHEKGARPYMVAARDLRPGEIHVSRITLNRENGRVETPHRPTLRVVAPVHRPDGMLYAAVVLNVDLARLFDRASDVAGAGRRLYITNAQGDLLVHPDESRTFGFDLDRRHVLQDEHPEAAWITQGSGTRYSTPADSDGRWFLAMQRVQVDPDNPDRSVVVAHAASRADVLAPAARLRARSLLAGGAMLVIATVLAFLAARMLTGNLNRVTRAVEDFAAGRRNPDLPVHASDEIGVLARAFDDMAEEVHSREAERAHWADSIRSSVRKLTTSVEEILAAATQQSAGAEESAAMVTQTTATVEEVAATSEQAAERARAVAATADASHEAGQAGMAAVERTNDAMDDLHDRIDTIAEDVLGLAKQAEAVGEIIGTVEDIADQTNILALNASIEASRAGEHGRGFAVVASEIRTLADESKAATAQVARILGEIDRASKTAVVAMEEGTKGAAHTTEAVRDAGERIRELAAMLTEASESAGQIVASAGQQATGMEEISAAVAHINDSTRQSLAATRQTRSAAEDLSRLAASLHEMIEVRDGDGPDDDDPRPGGRTAGGAAADQPAPSPVMRHRGDGAAARNRVHTGAPDPGNGRGGAS